MEIETVAYGYIPMMLSEYCPMGVVARSCKKIKDVQLVKKVNMYLEILKAKNIEFPKIYSVEVLYITQLQTV